MQGACRQRLSGTPATGTSPTLPTSHILSVSPHESQSLLWLITCNSKRDLAEPRESHKLRAFSCAEHQQERPWQRQLCHLVNRACFRGWGSVLSRRTPGRQSIILMLETARACCSAAHAMRETERAMRDRAMRGRESDERERAMKERERESDERERAMKERERER